ncbi:uncharacterized protein [Linepithema humile]|uniref:uncharacterized protein n=1 Tax=Linepithema humile TaxID=83485 RepID=UPI00351EAFEA
MSKKTEKCRFASSSSDTEKAVSDDDSNEYPVQFENFDVFTNKKRVEHKKIEHDTNDSVEIDKTVSEREERQIMKAQLFELKEYQKQCLKDINLLHLKLNAISESISSLVIASKTIVKPTILPSEPLPILNLFPMDSAGLIQVEEWL